MSFVNRFFVKLTSKYVATDQFGNSYFEGKVKTSFGKYKRFVIYNGSDQTSKVPPDYHAWLHYLSDDILSKNEMYDWQLHYVPNLSGTKYVYNPSKVKRVNTYNSWSPDN